MAKTIYITQEQYNKIGQYITENNNEMLYNLNVQDGESPMDAASKAKDNIEAVGGSTVVNNTKYSKAEFTKNILKK